MRHQNRLLTCKQVHGPATSGGQIPLSVGKLQELIQLGHACFMGSTDYKYQPLSRLRGIEICLHTLCMVSVLFREREKEDPSTQVLLLLLQCCCCCSCCCCCWWWFCFILCLFISLCLFIYLFIYQLLRFELSSFNNDPINIARQRWERNLIKGTGHVRIHHFFSSLSLCLFPPAFSQGQCEANIAEITHQVSRNMNASTMKTLFPIDLI